MTTSTPSADTWIYDHLHKVYFHPLSNSYAVPDPATGQWNYIPASDFQSASSSSTSIAQPQPVQQQAPDGGEKEEGEIEDDMGWGGLMDPDKLAQIEKDSKSRSTSNSNSKTNGNNHKKDTFQELEKHPSYVVPYDDPSLYSFPPDRKDDTEEDHDDNRPKETSNHILRLVVVHSKCLEIGQVVIIDAREDGIQLGRDRCEKGGQARVRLREMEVSKTHAVIYWGKGDITQEDEEENGWWIVDLGSTHGTLLSNPSTNKTKTKRLSEPKHSSKPHSIQHLAEIKIGSTTFSAHIHPSWPCDECTVNGNHEILLDDGKPKSKLDTVTAQDQISDHEIPYAMDSSQKKQNTELKRKREMALLKDSLLRRNEVSSSNDEREEPKREYLDRSAMRRRLHPSSPPKSQSNSNRATPDRFETPSTPSFVGDVSREPNGPSKFASSILANQGWIPGAGLGKSNQGRAEPIAVEMRNEKKGLGAQNSKAAVDDGQAQGDWKMRAKQRRWEELSKSNAN
ncbi:hypothetical protein L486_01842 [Kwoniella mangroviensis CBS 10435]|uniref:G-patch domain-containing protein n=1 Tax=Kwoniella mangroviensis CBS 10435 TaxID=1331196 RepID=A0A1B9J340_9TREE|nr:hypothetical protein L486_01842 [Kwoniella mangroviensis CBS 10435]